MATNTTANAVGVGGIPGILSIQPKYMGSFAVCMLIAFAVPLALTFIVGKKKLSPVDMGQGTEGQNTADSDNTEKVIEAAELKAFLTGKVISLKEVGDGVFSEGVMGDGHGDLRGIIQKLDYLRALGIDYLWITPVFVSPMNDNGYDVADYYRINPKFGTMEDMDDLIAGCNERGIGLMMDMVFNHTSTDHEWFQRALAGEREYQDYYIFREGTPDQVPTNWQSKFGGSAWEYVPFLEEQRCQRFPFRCCKCDLKTGGF